MAKIVPVKDLQPAFNRAMLALFDQAGAESWTMAHAMNAWKEAYDSYVFHDHEWGWTVVAFNSEQDQIMFMLKWSR